MKHLYFTTILLLLFSGLKAQVINDDCQTATDIGVMDGTQTFNAPNFALYDTCILITNSGATTSYPYLYTTATCGSYHANGINTDVWIKFVSHNMFSITGLPYIAPPFDSVSITFWRGSDCSNMQAIANLVYPLDSPNYYFYDTIWNNSIAIMDTFYAQVSGLHLQDTGSVYLCFIGLGVHMGLSGGCYPVNAATDTICSTYTISKTDATQGNNGSISINMLGGNGPFTFLWGDGNTDSSRNNLAGGVYYVTIADVNGCAETDSVIIYGHCNSNITIRHNSIGLYAFATTGNPVDDEHYVWILDTDTIAGDSIGNTLSYRFDTTGIHTICLIKTNHTTLCVSDTCIQVNVENTRYVPLLDSINIWHYFLNMGGILPVPHISPRASDCPPGGSAWSYNAENEATGADTVINGKSYKRLLEWSRFYAADYKCTIGFIREVIDSGIIYFMSADNNQELLLYNFGLNKGDTIFLRFEYSDPYNFYLTGLYRVDSIGSFDIAYVNQPRRQFFLNSITHPVSTVNQFRWIEGIGNLFELLYPYMEFGFGGLIHQCPDYNINISPRILACYEHSSIEFYNSCTFTQAQPSGNCIQYVDTCNYFNVCSDINNLSSIASLSTYPNPAQEYFTLSINVKQASVFAVRLMDMHGRYVSEVTELGRLNEGEHNKTIKIAALPAGLYFIECNSTEGRLYKRLVIE